MVTTFSALSSSSEERMRSSRALGGGRFFAGTGAAFFTGFAAVLRAGFLGEGFAAFFAGLLALAVFFARGFFFFAAFRAEILWGQGVRFSTASATAPRAWPRNAVELCSLRRPSSTTSDGAEPRRRATPMRRASGADNGASTEPGRRTTAMGILAAICCQRRQRAN